MQYGGLINIKLNPINKRLLKFFLFIFIAIEGFTKKLLQLFLHKINHILKNLSYTVGYYKIIILKVSVCLYVQCRRSFTSCGKYNNPSSCFYYRKSPAIVEAIPGIYCPPVQWMPVYAVCMLARRPDQKSAASYIAKEALFHHQDCRSSFKSDLR